MSDYVKEKQPQKVLMVTECSMSDNVSVANKNVEFIRPCNLCGNMKRVTLKKIYDSIIYNQHEVTVDPKYADKARLSIERMLEIGRN